MGIIYLAVNKINHRWYVGLTKHTLEKRKKEHIGDALRGRKAMPFHAAIRKYGKDAFEWSVLEVCVDEDLSNKEREFILMLDSTGPSGYNVSEGGYGGPIRIGWHHTEETKLKLRMHTLGKRRSQEAIARMSRAQKGHTMSREARLKISNALKGKKKPPRSAEHLRNLSLRSMGQRVSEEQKQNISNALKGKKKPDGFGAKIAAHHKRRREMKNGIACRATV